MFRPAIITSILLILLGVGAFVLSEAKSVTALIPAFFGFILLILAAISRKSPAANKHCMHVAALVGLLGVGGGLSRAIGPAMQAMKSGETLAFATTVQLLMGIICLIFLVLCVRSFIAVRRARNIAAK